MRILFFGDIVGRSGRELLIREISRIRADLAVDFVIANAENAAHGFGLNPDIAGKILSAPIDCITLGDHAWDQMTIGPYMDEEPRIIRPANFAPHSFGQGWGVFETAAGKILVISLLGRLFMRQEIADGASPFEKIDMILSEYKLGRNVDAIFVDFHAETTSEKASMGNYLDGRVSAVIGTHTHVPTADARILPKGTAFLTDAGMCGVFDSSIGMGADAALDHFLDPNSRMRLTPAEGEATLCGAIVDTSAGTIRQVFFGKSLNS